DVARHNSFSRLVTPECLFCHVGHLKVEEDNAFKMTIIERSIGCERCHGPGQAHVAAAESGSLEGIRDGTKDSVDPLIVHPGKLDRSASEAVCQQCHLQAATQITASGKNVWDFRPGQTLAENRSDFQLAGEKAFKIVGHVEQLHVSRCYIESDMTCVTCHDPHHRPPTEDLPELYRNVCLSCHEDQACGLTKDVRLERNDNDCAKCHMPRSETNVAHASLHHHTIAVHADGRVPKRKVEPSLPLWPVLSEQSLSSFEQLRRKSMAIVDSAVADAGAAASQDVLLTSVNGLMDAFRRKLADRAMRLSLAMLAESTGETEMAISTSQSLLDDPDRSDLRHSLALEILASQTFQQGDNAAALALYEELVGQRLVASDFYFLGLCRRNAGDHAGAKEACEKALRLNPDFIPAHSLLGVELQESDPDRASLHFRMVEALRRIEETKGP
ncbi:MAG: tetratricopeptide repeat protein, partial [Planctomycetota bacterium]